MAGNSRRRKRGRQDSDDGDGAPQAGPSTAPSDGKPATAALSSQGEAKRRRLAIETSSAMASSSPAPLVATSSSRRRNRGRSSNVKQTTPPATASTIKQDDDEEPEIVEANEQEKHSIAGAPQRAQTIVQVPSDTSSLSALSDQDVLDTIKDEENEDPNTVSSTVQPKHVSKEASSAAEPARQYTRAEKGKGRAKSPPANKQLRDEASRLQAELARLKAELATATSAIESHESFLNKVNEAFTCNICLEALRQPLALTCGHVFCQDDLWNWFHRESADSDGDSYDTSDSSSEDDQDLPHGNGLDDQTNRAARRQAHRRGADFPARLPAYRGSDTSDHLHISDDYNTDDTFDESTDASRSPSPVPVRSGARIQTTRGQQVAQQQVEQVNPPPRQTDTAAEPSEARRRERSSSSIIITGTSAAPPITAATNAPGVSSRVPALTRPKRLNLVCPQCRSRISIPPFPIFAMRGVSELLATQASATGADSSAPEQKGSSTIDATWGGLFPRAASGIGRSVFSHPYPAPPTAQAARAAALRAERNRAFRERLAVREAQIEGRAEAVPEDSGASESDSSASEDDSLNQLRAQVQHAQRTGEALSREQRTRAALHDLLPGPPAVLEDGTLPSLNGIRRRAEAEHLLVNDRGRMNQLNVLIQSREARRRAHRRAPRNPDVTASRQEEENLRDIEDRAVAIARRALLLSRVERPSHHASSSRGRDILRHGIRDAEDGVRRCIDCNWEIENGECLHCGAMYDSESEFDDNGDDLEAEVTSPPHATQEASELSFIERDQPSERDLASYADQTDEEAEDLIGSEASDETNAEESESEDDDTDNKNIAFRSRAGRSEGRRKVNRFMFDSEEDELEDEEEDEDESGFFVGDNEVEPMPTSEVDGLLDDDEEAEETDRETRRARREGRKQAKAARSLQARQNGDSTSGSSGSETEDDEDSSTDDEEEDDGDLQQSTSLTSPSVKEDDDEDSTASTSVQASRKKPEDRKKEAKSSLSARERAAKAAMSRNSTDQAAIEALGTNNEAKANGSGPSARRKRVIQASDEE